VFASLIHLTSCTSGRAKKKSELKWVTDIPVIGSQSSPRVTDLNKDGTLDIVMGAGKNEYQESDHGIVAFDGKTGSLLWKQTSIDQVYGSATLLDVNADKIDDIFIGGRSPQLKALDGSTGRVLWEFNADIYKNDPILKFARFNFNNCMLVPDQDGDGLQDLLTVNGGNSHAAPYSNKDRFPGVLMVLSSRSGKAIAADTMPDGKESYMTPVVLPKMSDKDISVIYGTGGETIDGNLYVALLSDLMNKNLRNSKKIASDTGHGFVAPATLADITGDDVLDIITITHGSKAMAIDGKDFHTIWTRRFPETECSNSFAAGHFNDDDVPDFFTFISKGVWPNSTGSVQVMLNGRNGVVEYIDSIGCTGFSSPAVYDLNQDGRDEAIISINEFDCSLGYSLKSPTVVENKLIVIDFNTRKVNTIDQSVGFKNVFSTPWLGDLDADGYLDVVSCQYFHHSNLLSFLGMRIKRIDLPVRIHKPVQWGAYLGSRGDGIFRD
jgi:outer membrane protein assembly factor BamB